MALSSVFLVVSDAMVVASSCDFKAMPVRKVSCAMVRFVRAATKAAARVWIKFRAPEV